MKRCIARPPIGFTLVELLVVIGIIGLLVAILVPAVQTARLQAEVAKTQGRITELAGGCDLYHKDFGYYPGQEKPGDLKGSSGSYTGSQYLAIDLFPAKYAQDEPGDLETINTIPNTITDRTSKKMAILYFPARKNLTGLLQFKHGDNSDYMPSSITDVKFKEYIRNAALDGDTAVNDDDLPYGDGKFIIVGPSYNGTYFGGGPTYPGL